MLLLELLRLGMLQGQALQFVPPSTAPSYDGEQEVRLLTNVFSVLQCQLKAEAWSGPLDHDILGFNSLVKALHRTLRNVLEAELVARVMRRECTAPAHELRSVALQLPFRQESGTALGIVLKHHLLGGADGAIAKLHDKFPECTDIVGDLARGRALWAKLHDAVALLNDAKELDKGIVALFQSANAKLASALKI